MPSGTSTGGERPRAAPRAPIALALALGLLGAAGCAHRAAPAAPRPAAPRPASSAPAPAAPPPSPWARLEQADAAPPRAPRRPASAPTAAWLRALSPPDLPITWDARLVAYLEQYRDDPRGRRIMTSWVEQLGAYRHVLEQHLVRQGLPRDLIAVSVIESGLRPGATSPKAAGGFWQFLPEVGRAYGLRVGYWLDERRDPEKSTIAAAHYLRDLEARFGNWELAFAGFNAGHGAVLNAITRFNTNDFWRLCRIEAGLPWETTEYVPKVLAVAIVLRNLGAFGYGDVAQAPRWEYDAVAAPGGLSFAEIGRRLGISADELQRLNPAMSRGRTPPDIALVTLRVPKGRGEDAAVALRRTPPSPDARRATLGPGETLARFARNRRVSLAELRRLNDIAADADVLPGTTLLLPRGAAKPAAGPAKRPGAPPAKAR